jgi:hypothetical protein
MITKNPKEWHIRVADMQLARGIVDAELAHVFLLTRWVASLRPLASVTSLCL